MEQRAEINPITEKQLSTEAIKAKADAQNEILQVLLAAEIDQKDVAKGIIHEVFSEFNEPSKIITTLQSRFSDEIKAGEGSPQAAKSKFMYDVSSLMFKYGPKMMQ